MTTLPVPQDLSALLAASHATPDFKAAVQALADGRPQGLVTAHYGAPAVKMLRVAMKLLEEWPELALASLAIEAASGCSNFTGRAIAQPGGVAVAFNWDCAWRARQEGWTNAHGDPDQPRAAQAFGYQCFERFEAKD